MFVCGRCHSHLQKSPTHGWASEIEQKCYCRSLRKPKSPKRLTRMPKPNSGNVGTGVGVAGAGGVGAAGVMLLLETEAALTPPPLVAVTENV